MEDKMEMERNEKVKKSVDFGNFEGELQPRLEECLDSSKGNGDNDLLYSINEEPPWYLTIFLGFQHYIMMTGSTVSIPFILCPAMCILEDDPARAQIISTIMFVSGILTIIQSTFGVRLPIVQGASFGYIVPILSILNLPQWKCPPEKDIIALPHEARTQLWETRMREIQGAIIIASLVEVGLGAFGFVGIMLKYITPMTVAPAIALLGISLFHIAGEHASSNWGIAILTILLITIFSQYMRNIELTIPCGKAGKKPSYPVFQMFPVLLTIIIVWALCGILTAFNVLKAGDPARTDIKLNVIRKSSWFFIPYPFQWGTPTITAGSVFGILSVVMAGAIESIGDYFACARMSGARPPPTHAINRGIFIEGLGCVTSGIFGTGIGTTSYTENLGVISVTKVGSRSVIQVAGVITIICALIGKFGAAFICIPEPIIGGIFCVVFATVTAVGLSSLQGVDLDSARNIFIIGFSIFFGLVISQWMDKNKTAIDLGNESLNQIITILLSTGMFVAGLLGFILDNTVPGTLEERGLHVWASHSKVNDDGEETPSNKDVTYDIPFITSFIKKVKWLRFIPISPTFGGKRNKEEELPKTFIAVPTNSPRISVSAGAEETIEINGLNGTSQKANGKPIT